MISASDMMLLEEPASMLMELETDVVELRIDKPPEKVVKMPESPTSPTGGEAKSKPVSRNRSTRSSLLSIITNKDSGPFPTSPTSPPPLSPPIAESSETDEVKVKSDTPPKSKSDLKDVVDVKSPEISVPEADQTGVEQAELNVAKKVVTAPKLDPKSLVRLESDQVEDNVTQLKSGIPKAPQPELEDVLKTEPDGSVEQSTLPLSQEQVSIEISTNKPDTEKKSPSISVEVQNPEPIEISRSAESPPPVEIENVEISIPLPSDAFVSEHDSSFNVSDFPAPPEDLITELQTEDAEDLEFPAPPPDDEIQEALDKIQSKYESVEMMKMNGEPEISGSVADPLSPSAAAVEQVTVKEEPCPDEVDRVAMSTPVLIDATNKPTLTQQKKSPPSVMAKSVKAMHVKADLARKRSSASSQPKPVIVVKHDSKVNNKQEETDEVISAPWEKVQSPTEGRPKEMEEIDRRVSVSERAQGIALLLNKHGAPPPDHSTEDRTSSFNSHLSGSEQLSTSDMASVGSPGTEDSNERDGGFPAVPLNAKTSSFSALDTIDDPSSDKKSESPYSRPVINGHNSMVNGLGNGSFSSNMVTSQTTDDSGIYSVVGETIEVKLRSARNDNKKPDYSVPHFERNSDLKRVTFQPKRNSSHQEIIPTSHPHTRLSAMQEERLKQTGLSEDDIQQAELFYKAHKTEVMVCKCLATLYFAEGASPDSINMDDWKPEHIGIPVLIYDSGEGKRSRGLNFVFAEKGTGFSLWKTKINYESRWENAEKKFHRLRVPEASNKLAGMAFQDEQSAEKFYQQYKATISDPELNVLNNPNFKPKKKKEKRSKSMKLKTRMPAKKSISTPCEFSHVTQLKQSEDGILALSMIHSIEDGSSDEGGNGVRFS